MELSIWFEQETKHVSGVTEATSCHDLIMAIAQSVGMTGCYSLAMRHQIQNGQMDEIILAPTDRPLILLSRRGLNPLAVQFILRRRATESGPNSNNPGVNDSLDYKKSSQIQQPPSNKDDNLSRKWTDQLSYQEQEIEYNRLQLLQLEKELAHLEKQCRLADPPKLQQAVQEQREELFALQRADYPRLLAEEKQRSAELQSQFSQIQEELKHLDLSGKQTKEKIVVLEQKVAYAMEQCLTALRDSNLQLQNEVLQLEKSGGAVGGMPRPRSASKQNSPANNSYWV